jgi:hypothetical protein
MNTLTREWNGLVSRLFAGSGRQERIDLRAGLVGGTFFGIAILAGTGNAWMAANVWAGAFLCFANILGFDDHRIGLASGFLAALCASGVIGEIFGTDVGWLTAFGVFAAVAPAVHMMDTEPGWGCDGRNVLAVLWAACSTALFLAWFLDGHTLSPLGLGVAY